MNSALLGLLLLVSAVVCQVPVPCKTPPQWESRYFAYDPAQRANVRARFSYDSIYKRERVIEEFRLGAEDDFYDVLALFNQGVEYVFNLKTKVCTKQVLNRAWRDFGIPNNATFLGESYIGSSAVPNANLLATLWSREFVDQKGNKVEYMGAWTYEACLPISYDLFSQNDRQHVNFFDITPGIDNPNVFVPRPECLKL